MRLDVMSTLWSLRADLSDILLEKEISCESMAATLVGQADMSGLLM